MNKIECKAFQQQPCKKTVCCRKCRKYEKCSLAKCNNDPKKCGELAYKL